MQKSSDGWIIPWTIFILIFHFVFSIEQHTTDALRDTLSSITPLIEMKPYLTHAEQVSSTPHFILEHWHWYKEKSEKIKGISVCTTTYILLMIVDIEILIFYISDIS